MGKCVLVVEDDQDIRETLREALRDAGYTVFEAANAHDGLAWLNNRHAGHDPCLILLDMMMPGMGGAEFIAEMRTHDSIGSIPVTVMTAHPTIKLPHGQNVVRMLRKPFALDVLLHVVDEYCAKSAAAPAAGG